MNKNPVCPECNAEYKRVYVVGFGSGYRQQCDCAAQADICPGVWLIAESLA